jgi:hypothetical protein
MQMKQNTFQQTAIVTPQKSYFYYIKKPEMFK